MNWNVNWNVIVIEFSLIIFFVVFIGSIKFIIDLIDNSLKSYDVLDSFKKIPPDITKSLGFLLFTPLRIFNSVNSEWIPNSEVSFAFDFACLLCQVLILFDWIKLDAIKLPFKPKNQLITKKLWRLIKC